MSTSGSRAIFRVATAHDRASAWRCRHGRRPASLPGSSNAGLAASALRGLAVAPHRRAAMVSRGGRRRGRRRQDPLGHRVRRPGPPPGRPRPGWRPGRGRGRPGLRAAGRGPTPSQECWIRTSWSGCVGGGRGELARLVPELATPDPTPPGGPQAAGPTAPGRLFELLLAVEDLHWADQSTRDLLGFLVHTCAAGGPGPDLPQRRAAPPPPAAAVPGRAGPQRPDPTVAAVRPGRGAAGRVVWWEARTAAGLASRCWPALTHTPRLWARPGHRVLYFIGVHWHLAGAGCSSRTGWAIPRCGPAWR